MSLAAAWAVIALFTLFVITVLIRLGLELKVTPRYRDWPEAVGEGGAVGTLVCIVGVILFAVISALTIAVQRVFA